MGSEAQTAALPEPWRMAFELAWEAFRAGSRPVGAVLVDSRGRVVASGRNRSQESAAPPGQLAGAAIAHAELNVLAQLPAHHRYGDHRLYTTLEPCLLCSSALIHAHVGTVVYAASDSLWRGVENVPHVGGAIAERWARREGPLEGPLSVFAAMLMDLWSLVHASPTDGRELPGGDFVSLARRCLDVNGFLDATTAQAAYRLAWPCLTAESPDLDRTPR
ncbi:nucleoside deaminase [Streptomyces sp. NPDC002928]|uniref:nucleoside deaminase n=1 Tax=Streptomyces sp. NPDC002928 TaxID=3154440 RepID=UPI0033A75192